jgi:SPP1 family predicted phage head-tail adaptor
MADVNISISDLRTQITLLTPTISTDAGKAQKVTYADFTVNPTVWARIIFAHGQESVSSDASKNVQRLTVTIRYRSDVDATHAMRMNGEVWKFIGTPDNIQMRNRWLDIQAELVKGTV